MSKNKSITEEALVAIMDEKLSPIMQTVNYLNGSVKLLSEKFDNVCKKIESLDKELKDVKSENRHLKSEVLRLSGVVDQQKSELNYIQQYLRHDCVEISGLPQEKDENLNDLVLRLGSLMNVELHEDDISITHRLPVSRNENQRVTRSSANTIAKVIVKFTRRSTKEKFYHGTVDCN